MQPQVHFPSSHRLSFHKCKSNLKPNYPFNIPLLDLPQFEQDKDASRSTTPTSTTSPTPQSKYYNSRKLLVPQWLPDDVSAWLGSISLKKYAPLFLQQMIDGPCLLEMEVRDFSLLGIDNPHHQNILLHEIQQLLTHFEVTVRSWTSDELASYLTSADVDGLLVEFIRKQKITGEHFWNLDERFPKKDRKISKSIWNFLIEIQDDLLCRTRSNQDSGTLSPREGLVADLSLMEERDTPNQLSSPQKVLSWDRPVSPIVVGSPRSYLPRSNEPNSMVLTLGESHNAQNLEVLSSPRNQMADDLTNQQARHVVFYSPRETFSPRPTDQQNLVYLKMKCVPTDEVLWKCLSFDEKLSDFNEWININFGPQYVAKFLSLDGARTIELDGHLRVLYRLAQQKDITLFLHEKPNFSPNSAPTINPNTLASTLSNALPNKPQSPPPL
jgi:hypothetical protein